MEIKLLSCPLCSKPHFDGVDSLRATLVNVATSHLSCPVCNEMLLGLDKLTIHLFSHINNVEVNVENNADQDCVHVEEIQSNDQEYIHHVIDKSIDIIANNNKEDLDVIQKSVIKEESLTAKEKSIRCDICGFCFTDRNMLDMHQKLLHQTTPDKKTGLYSYYCHLCTKKFKMRGSLMVHLRVVHYGFSHDHPVVSTKESKEDYKVNKTKIQENKQWECDVCSKMFTTKYFLKKHKRLHTGEMPYTCTQCNKSFTFQQSYHKHMLYHSSEKPYVCNECGRSFKELSTLQNHSRIHSGERPFGCETCGKRFRQRVSYLVHRRIHTGVMPYKCTACDKSFRYKVSQRSHKCPMNPPGSVVIVSEAQTQVANTPVEMSNADVKCIMTVDYSTGNINFVPENNVIQTATVKKEVANNTDEMDLRFGQSLISDVPSQQHVNQKDLFSMVLSPLLPEVESLCLSNSNTPLHSPPENIQINEFQDVTLENLLYDPNK